MKNKRARRNQVLSLPPIGHLGELSFLSCDENVPALNALTVARSVFVLEQQLRERVVRTVRIPIFEPAKLGYDLAELAAGLNDLLVFVLTEDVEIVFDSMSVPASVGTTAQPGLAKVGNLCLFSGGVDSYSGILQAQGEPDSLEGVFCGHANQSKIIAIVRELGNGPLKRRNIRLRNVAVPPIAKGAYAQLRGFLYLLAAGVWIHMLRCERLLVTECGPTMYQPRFGPFDAITMTTHPVVVASARATLRLLLKREVEITTPFENMTKADVVATAPAKPGLLETHSCITQRFGDHDGTCYGCVIRRLAFVAAGVQDVSYLDDPITDESSRSGNLIALLLFCFDFLTRYSAMDEYKTGSLEAYGKQDLFRRFALDNFAALHRLRAEGVPLSSTVASIYEELLESLGPEQLDARLDELHVVAQRADRDDHNVTSTSSVPIK